MGDDEAYEIQKIENRCRHHTSTDESDVSDEYNENDDDYEVTARPQEIVIYLGNFITRASFPGRSASLNLIRLDSEPRSLVSRMTSPLE